MSIANTDLLLMSAASVPTDDVSTTGGAISTTSRPTITQFGSNAIVEVVSDGADTRTVTVTGRNAAGVVDTEVLTLNGTTAVDGAKTWERIISVVASATSGTRTVTCKQGAAGATFATILPNETKRHIFFANAASDPVTTKARSEKHFWKNNHGSLTLTNSQVTLTVDPSSDTTIALPATIDDTATIANRLASTGLTFSGVGVAINVPNSQNIPAGSAIGVWVLQTLSANAAATRSTFTTKLSGQST